MEGPSIGSEPEPEGCRSPGDPRGFKVALRLDSPPPCYHGHKATTPVPHLALIPQSKQKEIAQLIEITSISHFPRLGLTLKH